jgi:hypothetical protein
MSHKQMGVSVPSGDHHRQRLQKAALQKKWLPE